MVVRIPPPASGINLAPVYRLVFHPPGDAARTVPLADARPLTLGRGEDNAIRLDDLTISRHHARLIPTPAGGWLVEDLQSSNGCRLNGEPFVRAELAAGDELRFGEMPASYRSPTPEEQAHDAAEAARAEPTVGRTFAGRYRLNRSLGETQEYESFAADDLARAGQAVALRVFRPAVTEAAGGVEAMGQRFEAVRAAPTHPNLAELLDFAPWHRSAYLTAGWIDGHPLLDVLRNRAILTMDEALLFARQAAAVTTYARAHRLPSPDLHPGTILIVFDPPPRPRDAPEPWHKLLVRPVDRWPAFSLKIMPQLSAPDLARYPFGVLLCELLGSPSVCEALKRPAKVVIPSLGDTGNMVLSRGLASRGEAFGGDAAFVEILARTADAR